VFNRYYQLTKPGIIYGNLLTVAAGFFLASKGHIDIGLLVAIMVGTSLVIASACVFNNYIDRGIDVAMARTKERSLVKGEISAPSALIYASVLGLVGAMVLAVYTNWLTFVIGLAAFVVYVAVYGLAKRRSVHGTIVGSFAGAAPILAGYTAVSDRLDAAAIILFIIMVVWQMPHFYAIASYRFDDYKAAKLPVLPVKRGMRATKFWVVGYIAVYLAAVTSLTVFGYTGYVYLVVMLLLGVNWLRLGLTGFRTTDDKTWGRRVFRFSLVVMLAFSILVSLGRLLL
jgi:protoheme IX farnesyltransferase